MTRPPDTIFEDRPGWAVQFLSTLRPGEARALPEDRQSKYGRTTVTAAARRRGLRVVTRSWEGQLWAYLKEQA